ncbi:hypothetical protein [Lacticaseibacillus sharpeae]|uniref:hypothetical protein n=1 Tax=Lacticaseibacillus sharpeae TaxID=1626 RepID=UPI0006D0B06D|nr:hypothetical protein [Lacticaseibacillus sharpeae]
MNDKKSLSIRAYLNEIEYCLEKTDDASLERARRLVRVTREILEERRKGDFEEGFLNDNND